jgi:hypothetical protein
MTKAEQVRLARLSSYILFAVNTRTDPSDLRSGCRAEGNRTERVEVCDAWLFSDVPHE